MGVFSRENQPDEGRKRNPFDGSFQNNLTFNFGQMVPCLCREVIGGDSFRINTAFGLRFMPTAFPLQTKMKAKIDFFYVRYRNLWDSWKNYYMKTGRPDSFPILSDAEALEQTKTGSLGDYLGLPSTVVQAGLTVVNSRAVAPRGKGVLELTVPSYGSNPSYPAQTLINPIDSSDVEFYVYRNSASSSSTDYASISVVALNSQESIVANGMQYFKLPLAGSTESLYQAVSAGTIRVGVNFIGTSAFDGVVRPEAFGAPVCIASEGSLWVNYQGKDGVYKSGSVTITLFGQAVRGSSSSDRPGNSGSIGEGAPGINSIRNLPSLYLDSNGTAYNVVDYGVFGSPVPYKISALPFRAYEQIYNAFYRDDRNNPYYVDGVNDPNVFLPTYKGGVDDNKYRIRYRNWEQDFLTTALPSPQYGNAPLVGLTEAGVATFQLEDGSTISSQLSVAEDGDTMVGFSTTNQPIVNRTLSEMATQGISINDLRGVNAMQRYLEAKYRASLRYRNQMHIHFGVDIKYDELDMPEFLGSVSTMVNVDQINQNSASTTDNPLGSYAGQLSAMGGSNGRIQHYFDEPGLLIGIVSVVPVPCYSQLLPKHFTKVNDPLEYYFSEFAHLGFQSIPYREVCPLQASVNGVALDSTFGYQRPWYDYISAVDEIHGQFRTTLNNFVMARVFNQVPSLNEEFLTVRPESLNDVFTISSVEDPVNPDNKIPIDTILGQIHFDIVMQRPIPRFGIARLE